MNCQEIREQLDEALDDQRVISSVNDASRYAGIVSHVESCADCRVLYEEHLLIRSALATWIPRRPIVDLTDRVIETARREGLVFSNGSEVVTEFVGAGVLAGRSALDTGNVVSSEFPDAALTRRSILPTIVTVALVLVAVAIVFRGKPGDIAKKEDTPLQSPTDRQPELFAPPQDQVADIGHLVADAQSAWQGITSRVTHQASGFSVFVPDLKNELGIPGDADSAELDREANSSDRDVDSQNQSEPSAVDRAFEFLFKDDDSGGTLTI
jgi:hypothetical protein